MIADWSAEQRQVLAALGYTLYRPIDTAPATADPASAPEDHSALSKALLRAAGLDPGSKADAASWLRARGLPLPTQLRGDPLAKRALWPLLRALRRERPAP